MIPYNSSYQSSTSRPNFSPSSSPSFQPSYAAPSFTPSYLPPGRVTSLPTSMPSINPPRSFTPPSFNSSPLQGRTQPFTTPTWINQAPPSLSSHSAQSNISFPSFQPSYPSYPNISLPTPQSMSSTPLRGISPPNFQLGPIAIPSFSQPSTIVPFTDPWRPSWAPTPPPSLSFNTQISTRPYPQRQWTFAPPTLNIGSGDHSRQYLDKALHDMYNTPPPPKPLWSIVDRAHFAFQIDAQTTVFVDPLALGDFLHRATPRQREAAQGQLLQLAITTESVQQIAPAHVPSLPNRPLFRVVRDLSSYLLSNVTHQVYDFYANERASATQILGWVEKLTGRLINSPSIQTSSQDLREQMSAGHVRIDAFFATNQAYRYDPNFQAPAPLRVVSGEIPFMSGGGAASLVGRAQQLTAIEGTVGGTRAIAAEAFGNRTRAAQETRALPKRLTPSNNVAYNRATFEEYKVTLRMQMEKPHVVDPKLKDYVDYIYKPYARIGSGSTAAAIRHELASGEKVFERFHSQKGRDMATTLEKWLRNNPTASSGDRAAAENILKDLRNALGD